jgi:hypothetical protein
MKQTKTDLTLSDLDVPETDLDSPGSARTCPKLTKNVLDPLKSD